MREGRLPFIMHRKDSLMPTMPPKSGHFNPGLPMPKVPTHTMRGNSGNDSGNEIDKNGNAARLLINRRRRPTRAQTPEKISARAIRFIPATSPATIPARFRQDSGNKIGNIGNITHPPYLTHCRHIGDRLYPVENQNTGKNGSEIGSESGNTIRYRILSDLN
jgi:hypothetical protein